MASRTASITTPLISDPFGSAQVGSAPRALRHPWDTTAMPAATSPGPAKAVLAAAANSALPAVLSDDVPALSNFLGGLHRFPRRVSDPTVPPTPEIEVREVRGPDLVTAVAFALGQGKASADTRTVQSFIDYSDARGNRIGSVRAVRHRGRLACVVLPVISPGRTSLLLMQPQLPRRHPAALEDAVAEAINGACDAERQRGCRLTQILLPADANHLTRIATERCGFWRLADLDYLQKRARRVSADRLKLPTGWHLRSYSESTHAQFAEAIEASYKGSLDCPALAGRRDIEDVIAGHKAAGEFHPANWHVLVDGTSDRPQSRGVLLLAGVGALGTGGMEIVYIGLTPEARGMGLGAVLLAHAEATAHRTSGQVLALAVDAGNAPATRLYARQGLRRVQRRLALVRDLAE